MKIAKLDAIPLRVPFSPGGPPTGWDGTALTLREMVLVRVETDGGLAPGRPMKLLAHMDHMHLIDPTTQAVI